MTLRVPASLRLTVPLILLLFAAALSTFNVLYHVPRAERAAEDASRKRLAQELSRLQSTLEYLLLKGDRAIAQREVAVLAHNHEVVVAALSDDRNQIIAATRRAWLERPITEVMPQFDLDQATRAARERHARVTFDAGGDALLGYTGILIGSEREEVRPSRSGSLFLVYDLQRPKAEARAQVIEQSLYWAGWVSALAFVLWLVFHFLLTRRTAQLVRAAEQLAAGDLSARSHLRGHDELGRLGRAFDAMAIEVAETQRRLEQDIAERVRVQQALQDSEEQYRSMFNASIDGLALWNAAGEMVDANPALWRMYGYEDGEEPHGAPPADRPRGTGGDGGAGGAAGTGSAGDAGGAGTAGDAGDPGGLGSVAGPGGPSGPSYRPDFLRAIVAGRPVHAEMTEVRRDGSALEVEVYGIPMHYRGEPHALTIARDITERKRSAQELERQREALYQREKLAALGSLLAGVAHELNNPLSVVVARAVLLEEQGAPAVQAAAGKIRTAAERCARIVRTFLAMARQQRPERGPVAINEVVSAALDITAYAVRTSGIEVTLDLAEDIPPIPADADQLHQVVLNLIINAQHALQDQPPPRRLRIATRHDRTAGTVRVAVTDNGPGVPPGLRTRIFEPYFTTKPTGVGTGVGLSVSLGIVEAHGGTLTLDCPPEAEGGGSVFEAVLPAGSGVPASGADAAPSEDAGAHERTTILVVDDEADVREALAEILAGARHRVVTAASGREALERLAAGTGRYDAVVTDIRMPDLDGRALYEEISRRWPALADRVVFVTGDTLASTLREFVSGSGRPVIEKPFLPGDVRRVVDGVATDCSRDRRA